MISTRSLASHYLFMVALGLALLFEPIWLPFVASSAPPTEPIVITAPAGIAQHYTNPQMFRDRTGAVYAATRAPSNIGGVVWRYVEGKADIVLALGPKEMYANGELKLWPDGYLYYITVPCPQAPDPPCSSNMMIAHPVQGWVPNE